MTEQQAIEVLKKANDYSIKAVEELKQCEDEVKRTERYGEYYQILENCLKEREACDMAIEALEKQIPKKPDYEADGYDENGNLIYDYAKCPICGHDFEYDINDWGCNYCSDCGQKLDWSE